MGIEPEESVDQNWQEKDDGNEEDGEPKVRGGKGSENDTIGCEGASAGYEAYGHG